MEQVTVSTLGQRYPIFIGPGLLASLDTQVLPFAPTRIALISNQTVMDLHGAAVLTACERVAPTRVLCVEDGETAKCLASLGNVLDGMAAAGLDRRSLVVALGGGVVGDLAGFAAAVYMRGIGFVQVPTTLLAQVDSSVGGKTGINLAAGKNLVGAFHQPLAVVSDTNTLKTLPARELSAGLAEVIKHGLLADLAYLDQTERDLPALLDGEADALARAIAGSCRIKAQVVGRDEREAGERALLNLGHTFGHAIENLSGYGSYLHGEAVGLGLCLAADLSHRLGLIGHPEAQRVWRLVRAARLPTAMPSLTVADMMAAMRGDKKAFAGQVKFVVMTALGRAQTRAVDDTLIEALLRDHGFA